MGRLTNSARASDVQQKGKKPGRQKRCRVEREVNAIGRTHHVIAKVVLHTSLRADELVEVEDRRVKFGGVSAHKLVVTPQSRRTVLIPLSTVGHLSIPGTRGGHKNQCGVRGSGIGRHVTKRLRDSIAERLVVNVAPLSTKTQVARFPATRQHHNDIGMKRCDGTVPERRRGEGAVAEKGARVGASKNKLMDPLPRDPEEVGDLRDAYEVRLLRHPSSVPLTYDNIVVS